MDTKMVAIKAWGGWPFCDVWIVYLVYSPCVDLSGFHYNVFTMQWFPPGPWVHAALLYTRVQVHFCSSTTKQRKTSSKLHFYAECRTIFVSHRIALLSSATSDFLNRPQFRLRSVVCSASTLMVSPRMNLTQISGFPQLKSRARRGVLIISLPQPGNSIKL